MRKNLKCGVVSEVQCKWFTDAIGCGLPDDVECPAELNAPKLERNSQLRMIANRYGFDHQSDLAIEEMAELIKELNKYRRGRQNFDHICEEIADVEIMLEQLKYLLNCRLQVDLWVEKKIDRTIERMENV